MPRKKIVEEHAAQATVEAPVKPKVRRPRAKKAVLTPAPVVIEEKHVEPEPGGVFLDGTPHVSVVIPAYNEAERIAPTLVEVHAYFASRNEPFEVLVVDDGSADRTAEIVERMREDFPQLRLMRLPENQGKGAAVQKGMLAVSGNVRLFADADGSTPFSEYEKLEEALRAGADVAFGSRALKESVVRPPQKLVRRILGKGSNLIIQATNLPGVHDTQCGFKAFTAKAAEAVFPHLTQFRWGFDIEALVIARRLGLKVKEVAVFWRDKAGTTVRPGAYLQTLGEDLRIRYNAATGAYPKR